MIKPAPPNPNATVPKNWPEYGTLDGSRVCLADAVKTLPPETLACIVVEFDDGPSQPWKGSDYGIADDGKIVL